jgi:O-antigen/teichoic acid export membrane protein
MLFSKEHIKRKVSYMGIAAMVSAFAMFLLAPRFGMKGAAISAVIAEVLLLVLYVAATIRYIDGITISATFRRKTLVESHEYVTGKTRTAI